MEKKTEQYVNKLFWMDGELYVVTRVGAKVKGSSQIPKRVELVEW